MPEKIFSLESRASSGSAVSLACCAGDLGVHAAAIGSPPPTRFPSSSTRSCSTPSTHLGARKRAARDADEDWPWRRERSREEDEEGDAAAVVAMGDGRGCGTKARVWGGGDGSEMGPKRRRPCSCRSSGPRGGGAVVVVVSVLASWGSL